MENKSPTELTDRIIAFENDELEWDEVVDLFQRLIDTGYVWVLQGSYGRMAHELIRTGKCTAPGRGE